MLQRTFFALTAALVLTPACAKKSTSTTASPTATLPSLPAPAPSPTTTAAASSGSAVDDPAAQKDLVVQQLASAIAALSDGGSGSAGGGAGGAGLVDLASAFAEARTCSVIKTDGALTMTGADGSTWQLPAGTPVVNIARTYSGVIGNTAYNANADNTVSGDSEAWYPGPAFGMQNITPDGVSTAAVKTWGTVPAPASSGAVATLPLPPAPIAGAATGSSGAVGSVGWRSTDGSWTGAPVWEVGSGYQGPSKLAVAQTEGMVMYYTLKMPVVTPAATAPTIGGKFAPLVMSAAGGKTASPFSILGQLGGGALPSFQADGLALVKSVATAVGQAGTVTTAGLPGKVYNPAAALTCDKAATNANPNWRFSQNVAGLTKLITTKTNVTKTFAKASSVHTAAGTRTVTWMDPARIPPASPAGAYFDQNAGVMSLTRSIQIGAEASPNTFTSELTVLGAPTKPEVINTSYTSTPLVDTLTRDLLDGSWHWTSRTVQSGTINTTHTIGKGAAVATVATTFDHVQWTYNADATVACQPQSGTLTTVITPVDTTKQTTTMTLKFGSSVGITAADGVTVTVACAGGAPGATNCSPVAETDDVDYKPTGCNF